MTTIIYTSNTGFTAQYAKMLAKKLNLPVYSADDTSNVKSGSDVIYFGWIMASKVMGYKKAAKRFKIIAVCAVGMGGSQMQTDEVRQLNAIPENISLFKLQGGFDINKLHGIYKALISIFNKSLSKSLAAKTDRTPDEDRMLEMMLHGGSCVSEQNLEPVIDWYFSYSDSLK